MTSCDLQIQSTYMYLTIIQKYVACIPHLLYILNMGAHDLNMQIWPCSLCISFLFSRSMSKYLGRRAVRGASLLRAPVVSASRHPTMPQDPG